jgi:hypothetical protein
VHARIVGWVAARALVAVKHGVGVVAGAQLHALGDR